MCPLLKKFEEPTEKKIRNNVTTAVLQLGTPSLHLSSLHLKKSSIDY